MLRPKGKYNLIQIHITKDTATIEILEYSDSTIVKEWWTEKFREDMLFNSVEVWTAKHDGDSLLHLQWDRREFVCFRENKLKGHPLTPLGATGYAYLNSSDQDRRKICYECAADFDRKTMDETGEITLHLDGLISLRLAELPRTGKRNLKVKISVSNWCGSLSYPVDLVRVGNGGIAKVRRDIYFTDHKGANWHGVQFGNESQLVYCKRLKGDIPNAKNKRTNRGSGKAKSGETNRRGKRGADKQ